MQINNVNLFNTISRKRVNFPSFKSEEKSQFVDSRVNNNVYLESQDVLNSILVKKVSLISDIKNEDYKRKKIDLGNNSHLFFQKRM